MEVAAQGQRQRDREREAPGSPPPPTGRVKQSTTDIQRDRSEQREPKAAGG